MKRIFTYSFIISLLSIIIPDADLWAQKSPVSELEMKIKRIKEVHLEGTNVIFEIPFTKTGQQSNIQRIQTTNFIVNYTGFSAEAQDAFQRAVDLWDNLIDTELPIRIDATWLPIEPNATLGFATTSSVLANFPAAPQTNVWYPIALAEKITGQALNDPDEPDIISAFNSDRTDWYFGDPSGIGSNDIDVFSVVMHEIGHGLGFAGFFVTVENDIGIILSDGNGLVDNFTTFIENQGGTNLFANFTDNTSELGDQLTSDALFFKGVILENTPCGQCDSNGRAKIYAPDPFNPGSSFSHLDETTFVGTSNGLMTPFAEAGNVDDIPGISLQMLYDMGWWWTVIQHDPLNDTEDTVSNVTVTAQLISDTDYDTSSFTLHYSYDDFGAMDSTLTMVNDGSGNFSTDILVSGTEELISYYLTLNDEFSRVINNPGSAPEFFFQFRTGKDEEGPEIVHNPPTTFITESEVSLDFLANVTDNLGIDTIFIEMDLNGVALTSFGLDFDPGEFAPDKYTSTLDLRNFTFVDGDLITYRITATDSAINPNTSFHPSSTEFHEITVEGISATLDDYENDFELDNNDFFGDLFTAQLVVGFTDRAFHSPHPYEAAGTGNKIFLISQLKSPIRIKPDSATVIFDEIVLVEPPNLPDLWDLVFVEGSKNGGATWIPFIDGYDSSDDPNWLSAWNSGLTNGQDSDTPGNAGLYKERVIDMLSNPNFAPGDEVLIRFRLFSDPFAFGWGWAIDNLKIQKPQDAITGIEELISSESDLKIYPNPTHDGLVTILVNFTKPVDKIKVSVTGILGNQMIVDEISNVGNVFNYEVQLKDYPPGIYLVNLQFNEGMITRKIFKSN